MIDAIFIKSAKVFQLRRASLGDETVRDTKTMNRD